MSVIKPRARGKRLVKHRTRLDEENQETLYAYAAFLDESTEYVLNELIDVVLAKDKEFARWRTEHSGSFVPRPSHGIPAGAPHSESVIATAYPAPSLAPAS